MTYRWDEEEETRVDINDTKIEHNVDIPVGLHTLTVIVVDSNNKTTTKEQEVKGVTKPKLEVTTDGVANFIIKASDEQGLELINENLYQDLPQLDFVIRTSGEQRISNFMIYQSAYAEYYFPKTYFPDFDEKEFCLAILEYQKRNRRYGGNKKWNKE